MLQKLRSLFGHKPPLPNADARELFAAEVEAFLRTLPEVSEVKRAPDAYALDVVTPSGSRRAFLDNAFAESREIAPETRRAKIAFHFSAIGADDHTDTWEAARETLVPVLRGATYGISIWQERPSAAFLRRPFLPYVDEIVAMDRPTSMSFVSRAAIEGWRVDERAVFEAAHLRTPLLADPSVELYDDTHGPLWIVTSNDTYESSRLLVPGWLASFRGRVRGNPIAIVPERSTLMVGGDGQSGMVERLLDKAEREFAASNRRLSPALYSVDGGGKVVPYVPSADDPLAAKVQIAHEKLAMYEHDTQKRALEALHEKNGLDVFVASYQVFQAADAPLPRSVCVWTKGARSYLPRTEEVALVVLGQQPGDQPKLTLEVPFEAIRDRLTPVPDHHPERFETTGEFPSDDELRQLGGS